MRNLKISATSGYQIKQAQALFSQQAWLLTSSEWFACQDAPGCVLSFVPASCQRGIEKLTFDVCRRTKNRFCVKAKLANIFVSCDKFCLSSTSQPSRGVCSYSVNQHLFKKVSTIAVFPLPFLHSPAKCYAGTSLSFLWQVFRKANREPTVLRHVHLYHRETNWKH